MHLRPSMWLAKQKCSCQNAGIRRWLPRLSLVSRRAHWSWPVAIDEGREMFEKALRLAADDGSTYEMALASMGIARLDGDDAGVSYALAQLSELGVMAAPPGFLVGHLEIGGVDDPTTADKLHGGNQAVVAVAQPTGVEGHGQTALCAERVVGR